MPSLQDSSKSENQRSLAVLDLDDPAVVDRYFARSVPQLNQISTLVIPQINSGLIAQFARLSQNIAATQMRLVEAFNMTGGFLDQIRKTMEAFNRVTPGLSAYTMLATPVVEAEIVDASLAHFGFSAPIDGTIWYSEQRLQGLYQTSRHGKYLLMLLEADRNYVDDDHLRSRWGSGFHSKGAPGLMAELQRALARNGLRLEVTRRHNDGYQLKDVREA